jgi:hypothetical protein
MQIKYERSDNGTRYWNTDWILMVDTFNDESDEQFSVEITSAIPPGPQTRIGGMMTARSFITFKLRGEEARQFVEAYDKSARKKSSPSKSARPSGP